jgi:hypothetical protein
MAPLNGIEASGIDDANMAMSLDVIELMANGVVWRNGGRMCSSWWRCNHSSMLLVLELVCWPVPIKQASKRFSIANSNTMSSIKQLMCWSSNVGDAVKQQELGTDGAVLWSVDLVHCSHVLVESESALHIVSNSSACKIV